MGGDRVDRCEDRLYGGAQRIRKLEREVRERHLDNKILKLASAFFTNATTELGSELRGKIVDKAYM